MSDLIRRSDAINAAKKVIGAEASYKAWAILSELLEVPSAQPERLTDDDFETIRIHLSACKEKLCNQHRWKEAEEYQQIIDRFMSFANAQQEHKTGRWKDYPIADGCIQCSACGVLRMGEPSNYCPNCGAKMDGDKDG